MGVYLGNAGQVELVRKSLEGDKESVVNPSDVNSSANRFSFDFDEGFLITGDFVELSTTDGTDLDFVDASGWGVGAVQTSGNWYIFVDQLGGIKLYDNFADSLDGGTSGLVSLNTIARDIPIRARIRDADYRVLAAVSEYELNTNREVVDITTLSDEHRQQYSSLISGSGNLVAHWDYVNEGTREPVHYLMQLILRTEIGSSFRGKFYVKTENATPAAGSYNQAQVNDSLWWEFDAIVTGSAVSFSSSDLITGRIEFVATGPIRLKAQVAPGDKMLQESGDEILLDQDATSSLLLEAT